jgi:hypothetical protein
MSAVRNLPIARKFTYAFGIICLLCVALAGYTFFTLRGISAAAHEIGSDGVPSLVNLAKMRNDTNTVRRAELALILCQTPHGALQNRSPAGHRGLSRRRQIL